MCGETEPGSTRPTPPPLPSDIFAGIQKVDNSASDWVAVLTGFGTVRFRVQIRVDFGFTWDSDEHVWLRGDLTEGDTRKLKAAMLSKFAPKGGVLPFGFSAVKGGPMLEIARAKRLEIASSVQDKSPEAHWEPVARRAEGLLLEGVEDGSIHRREEIGYMAAIAALRDKKSRPIDRKNAIDLIMKLEDVFADRNQAKDTGDDAEGTKALIEKLISRGASIEPS